MKKTLAGLAFVGALALSGGCEQKKYTEDSFNEATQLPCPVFIPIYGRVGLQDLDGDNRVDVITTDPTGSMRPFAYFIFRGYEDKLIFSDKVEWTKEMPESLREKASIIYAGLKDMGLEFGRASGDLLEKE